MRAERPIEEMQLRVIETCPELLLFKLVGRTATEAVLERLTVTERLELEYVSLGYSNHDSAKERFVSFRTCKNQRESIRSKLGVHNMAHAVRLGCENDFFDGKLAAASTKGLTHTLLQELELASLGLTCAEAAPISLRGAKTIKNYRTIVINTLGARNMPHAVRIAFDNDLLPLEPQV